MKKIGRCANMREIYKTEEGKYIAIGASGITYTVFDPVYSDVEELLMAIGNYLGEKNVSK